MSEANWEVVKVEEAGVHVFKADMEEGPAKLLARRLTQMEEVGGIFVARPAGEEVAYLSRIELAIAGPTAAIRQLEVMMDLYEKYQRNELFHTVMISAPSGTAFGVLALKDGVAEIACAPTGEDWRRRPQSCMEIIPEAEAWILCPDEYVDRVYKFTEPTDGKDAAPGISGTHDDSGVSTPDDSQAGAGAGTDGGS